MKMFPKLLLAFGVAASVISALGAGIAHSARQAAGAAPGAVPHIDQIAALGYALVVVPFVLAVVLGVAITRTLGRRLARIEAGARAIAGGDLDHRIGDASKDEVGVLARALDATAQELAQSTVSCVHLDAVIASIADPLGVVDGDGVVRRINGAAAGAARPARRRGRRHARPRAVRRAARRGPGRHRGAVGRPVGHGLREPRTAGRTADACPSGCRWRGCRTPAASAAGWWSWPRT